MSDTTTPTMVSIEIAGMEVSLPLKFSPGHTLTDNQARILDAAYQRQFTNNQNALAKAREEKFKNAKTDAEREKARALTQAELAELYADYEPNVGSGQSRSAVARRRNEAAFLVFLDRVNQHNRLVKGGKEGLFRGQWLHTPFLLPTGKGVAEWRDTMAQNILSKPEYAPAVEKHLERLIAQKKEEETSTAKVKADTITADDLF